MNIEEQVCSLELSKKLKELGVKQESFYHWHYQVYTHEDFKWKLIDSSKFSYITYLSKENFISAFTVAELGELLPNCISIIENDELKKIFSNFKFVTYKSVTVFENNEFELLTTPVYVLNYICDSTNEMRNWIFDKLLIKAIYDKNEANARAKMLIYLIENGLIKND
jgi:hypothetical protein